MNELVEIQGTELQIKEYQGRRVVTLKDIDAVHQRPEGTARKRFADNRKRFINGVDFFKVKCREVSPFFGHTLPNGFNPNGDVTLITETGYMMLVKSFTDDLAWKVQRELVDSYFRVREETVEQTVTVTETKPVENHEVFLEAARIMATIPDSQRFVINCLRHVVSDIDLMQMEETTTEITTEVTASSGKKNKPPYWRNGVPIDINKLKIAMNYNHITIEQLATMVGVCNSTAWNWVNGNNKPVLENRTKICIALGEDKNFLTPKRKRNVRVP